ncbi:hypothetical protein CSB45_16115 [candidate division KSB3 bacterium]|uniref:RND efflux pump membrane fusion protein barrel-sandwich domain-containing protein n=1 Tax=candidate division KSB3 bacterium TaxID=2044937 RepID=A0A2G6E000_9BACT|nr:MAG: hypothetical protein CSB45_16115 [candidate division KSB3 bacterium]
MDYVFVARGDTIAPGDRIATINANDKTITISVDLSATLASVIDVSRPSTVSLSGRDISLLPTHLSRDVADDQSYVLTFTVPEEYSDLCNHNEYVSLSVPLEATQHDHNRVLVPVDAVRLMNNKTVIFIADGDRARAVEVVRGTVVGSLIFVTGDFPRDKKIIVSRNVYDGDHIMVDAK